MTKRPSPGTDEFFGNWVTQARKGLLELSILNVLSGQRLYGYDIVKMLRQVEGLFISEGTIYPILSRFRREGLVEASYEPSPEGPVRRYYTLTPAALQVLARMNEYWQRIKRGMDSTMREDRP